MTSFIDVDNDRKKELIDKFEFKNQHVNDVTIDLLLYADKHIDKSKALEQIKKYIKWDLFADYIERGIFEHAIIFVHTNGFPVPMLVNIYLDKLNDICANLDQTNKFIDNQTLKQSILNFEIKAYCVAFLPPEQLHPARWSDIMRKRQTREDLENNFSTTDLYRCKRCGDSKGVITQKQVRCPDEPITTFIKCKTCLTTFTR
jgi:DNA-directed RNA polymerase subunit M/transcription elongation factor TFIIS